MNVQGSFTEKHFPIDPSNFAPFPKNPLIAKFFIQLGRAEELGSGILTASRLAKEYAEKGKAEFIEGKTFKTIIRLRDGAAITVSDTISDTIKQRMSRVIHALVKQPGLKSKDLAKITGVSEVSIRRDMQKLTNW